MNLAATARQRGDVGPSTAITVVDSDDSDMDVDNAHDATYEPSAPSDWEAEYNASVTRPNSPQAVEDPTIAEASASFSFSLRLEDPWDSARELKLELD